MKVLHSGGLSLLWSEIEWPLDSSRVQNNAVEFHHAIGHIFGQTAVAPFRLLTVFENEQSLAAFAESQAAAFVADLERLEGLAQMECVIFFKMGRPADTSSGQAYLRQKAELRRAIEQYGTALKHALAPAAREIRLKEVNNGSRIFALVPKGQESAFRDMAAGVAAPEGIERRITGPWPPSEFLSDAVKTPQISPQSREGRNE